MAMKDDVYRNFNSKATEDLQRIWDENNRNEYSNVAFEVIEEILKERNVQIKPIREPIENQKENDGSFWSFDKMISGTLIKILYWLGVIGIIITGALMFQDDDTILLGIGLIIVGNLIWRIVCEGIIIIFKIFEKLNLIENKL